MKTPLSRYLTIGAATLTVVLLLLVLPGGMHRAAGQSPIPPPNLTATESFAKTATAEAAATEAAATASASATEAAAPTATAEAAEAEATAAEAAAETATAFVPPTATPANTLITSAPVPKTTSRRDVFWLTLATVLAAFFVLTGLLLVIGIAVWNNRPLDPIARVGRSVLEGIAIVLVVVAVIILGGQTVLSAQGIIAILSAITGFLLGQAGRTQNTGGDSDIPKPNPPPSVIPPPPAPDVPPPPAPGVQ